MVEWRAQCSGGMAARSGSVLPASSGEWMEPIVVEDTNNYGSHPALKVRNIHLGVDIISIMLDMYPRAFKNLPLDLKLASRSVQMYMYPNFPKAVENEGPP